MHLMRLYLKYTYIIWAFLIIRTALFSSLLAQQADDTPIVIIDNQKGSTSDLINILEQKSGWVISYSSRLCTKDNAQFKNLNQSLKSHIEDIFSDCDISLIIRDKRIIVKPATKYSTTAVVSGIVIDGSSGKRLSFTTLYDFINEKGVAANGYGFFSIHLPKGEVDLISNYVGYSPKLTSLFLDKDTFVVISMLSNTILDEIDVFSNSYISDLTSKSLGIDKVLTDDVKKMPILFGESDLMKSIQLLPGIQGGSEGFSGLYVRGGGPDQNLILMDDVPIYNVGHLLGFYSIFNVDAIKYVNVYKSGFPARYHGRLSSVIDIRMLDGNKEKISGVLNVGLLASSISLNGPIIKDKLGFAVSLRRTYLDPIISLMQEDEGFSLYYFYDINAKLNYDFSLKSKLYASFYYGLDKYSTSFNSQEISYIDDDGKDVKMSIEDTNKAGWGNTVGALRWNYIWNEKLFSNLTATYSDYQFFIELQNTDKINFEENIFEQRYKSGIENVSIKADFDCYPSNSHLVKFGAGYINHFFNPGIDIVTRGINSALNNDTTIGKENIYGGELNFYVEDEIILHKNFKVNIGLSNVYFFSESKTYNLFEPRLSIVYYPYKNWGFRGGYTQMSQYLHTISTSTIAMPTDLWLPVTDKIPPMLSKQLTFGTMFDFGKDGLYSFSVDGYYKSQSNLLNYKESTGFFDYSSNWEDKLTIGDGYSYGTEISLKKNKGKIHGWTSYTYAKTSNKFDDINDGNPFPMRYDRPHDIRINMSFLLNKKLTLNSLWQYGSGLPITLPEEKYFAPDLSFNNQFSGYSKQNGSYNSYRMPPYHRLDLSLIYTKKKEKTSRIIDVGVINAYGRKNPFMLYFSSESGEYTSPNQTLKQLSLLPIPIPYFKYSIIF